MTTKSKNLLILAALDLIASLTTGALVSVFEQSVSAKSLNGTSNVGTISIQNLTGSLKVFTRFSQIIQSKANISLSTAAIASEKAVGGGAHTVSTHTGMVNGYLMYTVRALDSNNNYHRLTIDAGNGKVLLSHQVPIGTQLMRQHIMSSRWRNTIFMQVWHDESS